jgi:glutathione S-transferase
MSKLKQEPYVSVNPNGRVPAIHDPNTGITLWESGACIKYLVDEYDKDHKISYGKSPETYHELQYLMFQVSGQGPYYGQAAWFSVFHPEKLPSARDRYLREMQRVMGVLDSVLRKNKYLVGDKCTYADLSFIPWHNMIPFILGEDKLDIAGTYPRYHAWMGDMLARPAIKKVLQDKANAVGKH